MGILGRLSLGKGERPAALRAELEAEVMVMLQQGLGGSITYRVFRGPKRRCAVAAHRRLGDRRAGPRALPDGWETPLPYMRVVSAP